MKMIVDDRLASGSWLAGAAWFLANNLNIDVIV